LFENSKPAKIDFWGEPFITHTEGIFLSECYRITMFCFEGRNATNEITKKNMAVEQGNEC
jgi:hypothetical protein